MSWHLIQTSAEDNDLSRARREMVAQIPGPQYEGVEKYVPHEPEGANTPQESWRWGSLSDTMKLSVDDWVQENLQERVPGLVAKILPGLPLYMPNAPGAPPVVIVNPRNVVSDLLNEVMRHPAKVLGELLGTLPDDHATPAGRQGRTPVSEFGGSGGGDAGTV